MDRMALGMAAYARRPMPLCLVDLEDVTRYCCFVAGLVGEMLTELWAFDSSAPAPRFALAYHFGLFLQKVNILKDQDEDEAAGRFLVPDYTALCASLGADARGALAYLQALPPSERGYRTFCAWALMMGLVTVAQLDQPRQSRRAQTQELLARTAEIACDNAALGRQFVELMPELPPVEPQRAEDEARIGDLVPQHAARAAQRRRARGDRDRDLEPAQRLLLHGRGDGLAARRASEVRRQRLAARDDRGDRGLDRGVRARAGARRRGGGRATRSASPVASSIAIGFARSLPASGGAEPWIGSNIAWSSPTLQPTAMPMPPCRTDARSVRMSPNMFVVTHTS